MLPLQFLIMYSFLIIIFIHIVAKSIFRKTHSIITRAKNLPPGPWKLPLIGNLHQLSRNMLHHSLTELASKYGPIMYLKMGKIPTVIISSRELALHVLKKQGLNFAQRPQPKALQNMDNSRKGIGFYPYDESWINLRKTYVMDVLSKKRVGSLRNETQAAARDFEEIVLSKSSGKPINFSQEINRFTYHTNFRTIFGNRSKMSDHLISLLKEYASALSLLFLVENFPWLTFLYVRKLKSKYHNLEQQIFTLLQEMIEKYRAERRLMQQHMSTDPKISGNYQPLIDSLFDLQESWKIGDGKLCLTDEILIAIIKDVFVGGSDNTANALEWAMSELMKNPSKMSKAKEELRQILQGKQEIHFEDLEQLHYLKSIIKETLRVHPPTPLVGRECINGCEVLGYDIPKGTRVFINTWALARDRNYWKHPDEFQPERFMGSSISFRGFDFELLPFGAGRRICPGITYATAIIEICLARLLYKFDWELANGKTAEELDMTAITGVFNKRRDNLFLVASPAQL